jgi:alanine racemase
MDFISVESTKEEICIFNNAQKVANHFNTISYEILTSLKENIKRVVV